MTTFIKNPCNQYSLLWILYLLQGTLYEEGGVISQGILVIILCLGLLYLQRSFQYKYPKALKAAIFLLGMYVVYGFFRIFQGTIIVEESSIVAYRYLKTYLVSILPLFVFFYFRKNGYMNTEWFYKFVPLFFFTSVCAFYKYSASLQLLMGTDEVTNNAGYMFAFIIPSLFLLKKKPILQYILLACSFGFVIAAMKRGAILTATVLLVIFLYFSLKSSKNSRKLFVLFLSAFLVWGIYYYINYMINESTYFALRVEQTLEGESSNRDIIYNSIWHYFIDRMGVNMLFGLGADATLVYLGSYAHNDWLETAINQGIIGLIIMSVFFWTFFRNAITAKNKTTKIILFSAFCGLFLRSMISMSIGDIPIILSSICGYCFANIEKDVDPFGDIQHKYMDTLVSR